MRLNTDSYTGVTATRCMPTNGRRTFFRVKPGLSLVVKFSFTISKEVHVVYGMLHEGALSGRFSRATFFLFLRDAGFPS